MMAKFKTGDLNKLPFEEALKRLEEIVEKMENGSLPLEEMISCFEEGNALSKLCGKKLSELEKKIEILVKENASGGEWKDFESDDESENADIEDDATETVPESSEENGKLPF
ncbi:MAG: exodeoxyribonuclease VII small subunit [Lentisphaerae bacterium GWF2_45_14]|nr:MAG: exodeoxyribonuclease VII small subunit [Lentisphaerae bacterium GWF2_45_14]